jgi:antitoxin HicB
MNNPRFTIVIEPLSESDGGGYLATVPDLPGCM